MCAPTTALHRLAVSEGRYPCLDDGGQFRPYSDVSDEEDAAMRFGDWCLDASDIRLKQTLQLLQSVRLSFSLYSTVTHDRHILPQGRAYSAPECTIT